MTGSAKRIYAMILRQVYLTRRSPPRLISYCFWPTMDMIVWGFLNQYLYQNKAFVGFSMSLLLGTRLLYSLSERSHVQIMWGFLEDVWARNLGNMLISPLRPIELIVGVILNGFLSAAVGMSCAYLAAYFIFDYTIFKLGVAVLPMLIILIINSWWIGLTLITLILRYGPSGEHFGWMAGFVIVPLIAVFYPVSALPEWLQYISWSLPPTYVFESLRELIATQTLNMHYMMVGFVLSLVFLATSVVNFLYQLKKARQRGGLFSSSE